MSKLSRKIALGLPMAGPVRQAAAAFALGLMAWCAGHAQAQEIIVTAQRVELADRYPIPHVGLTRRADNLIVWVQLENDTREGPGRVRELKTTLEAVQRQAKADPSVEVGLVVEQGEDSEEEQRVVPFTLDAAMEEFKGGKRPDTTLVMVVLKTPVSDPAETLEAARARIDRFVDALPKDGRTLVTTYDEALSIINPTQYRQQIVQAIADDAARLKAAFGTGMGVDVEGLEQRVIWRQTGPLELNLFIPHRLKLHPLG